MTLEYLQQIEVHTELSRNYRTTTNESSSSTAFNPVFGTAKQKRENMKMIKYDQIRFHLPHRKCQSQCAWYSIRHCLCSLAVLGINKLVGHINQVTTFYHFTRKGYISIYLYV